MRVVPAQATIAFAHQLSAIAKEHNSDCLERYAADLLRSAETLDLRAAGRMLETFPKVIDYFSKPDA